MRNSRFKRRLSSFLYVLITAVVIIGMPIVLIQIAGWPLPTKAPNFSNISTAIQQQNIPDEVIIKALAVVLWLVWLQLVWSLIWEIIYVGPKLAKGLQAKSAPMSSSPMQHLAARLVGGIMSVGLITTSLSSNSILPTEFVPTLATAPAGSDREAIDEPIQADTAGNGQVWLVQPGDSLWSISNGNEAIMNGIFLANPEINTALDVEPGMHLVVPDELDVPADRLVEHLPEADISIVKGDHLWGIAEDRLEQSLPEDPSNAQIVDYVGKVVEANPSVQPNPDLIYPDDQYTFPEIGKEVPVVTPAPVGALPPEEVGGPSGGSPGSDADVGREMSEADQGILSSVGSLLTSPRGIVLGAGLFGLFLSLQQRQLVQGATNPLRRRARGGYPDDLIKASKLPLVEWAGKELSMLMAELKSQASDESTDHPQLLEVRLGDGIEVIWQNPQMAGVKPWEVTEGGRRWTLPYRANARVIRGEMPAAFGSLVTLGSRTLTGEPVERGRLRKDKPAESYSQSVLVNLSDYGTMSIVGTLEHTMATARSLVLELGTSENVANAKVLLVGLEIDGTEHMHRVKEGSEEEALALLRSAAVTQGPVDGAAIVVVSNESPHVQTLLAASPPGSGTAVVVVGAAENTRRHFVVQPNGVDAFFLDNQADVIEPVAVTAEQAADIAAALDEAVGGEPVLDWNIELDDGTAQAKAASIVLRLGSTPTPDSVVGAAPLKVDVLGEPSISGIDPNQAAMAAISLVLSSPTRTMLDVDVIETVWGSGTITTEEFWDEIEKLQQKLSSDSISRSSANELIVSPAVRTDLEIFASYVSQSVGLSEDDELILLLEALRLIDGVPFTGSPLCHWAYRPDTPLALQAIDLIEATALRAAELGVAARDFASADQAISKGLSGTGPNEPLIRMQMKIEAAKGNIDGVEAVFSDFSTTLSESSSWNKPIELSTETTELHSQLVSQRR